MHHSSIHRHCKHDFFVIVCVYININVCNIHVLKENVIFLDQDPSPIFAAVQILYLGLDQEWMLISLINN
jgi:hypothetical protein